MGRSKRTEPPFRIHRGRPVGYTVEARFDVATHGLARAWDLARETRNGLVLREYGKAIAELIPSRAPFILRWHGDRVIAEVSVHDAPPYWRRPRKVLSRTFPIGTNPEGPERNARLWAEVLLAVPGAQRGALAKHLARVPIRPAALTRFLQAFDATRASQAAAPVLQR